MLKSGIFFPDRGDSPSGWRPTVRYVALHRRVLAVARTRITGHWAAYIAPVPGERHDEEAEEVLLSGTKLHEEVARTLFPEWKEIPWAK